jgi:hypothetical protein
MLQYKGLVRLAGSQPAVFFSHIISAPATSQSTVFFSHNKSAPATRQPNEAKVGQCSCDHAFMHA